MSQALRIYSYPQCGTCRKALQWLAQQGFSMAAGNLDLVDITSTPPSPAELRQAFEALGRKRLFNTSGQSYRALGASTVQALDDSAALAALAADGKLIKRPFLVIDDGCIVTGFKELEWLELLG